MIKSVVLMYLECNFIIIYCDVLKDYVFEFLMINWWNVLLILYVVIFLMFVKKVFSKYCVRFYC